MKINFKLVFSLLATLVVLVSTSCSTPAYKQNKYKKAKRARDCGCNFTNPDETVMYTYNDQR